MPKKISQYDSASDFSGAEEFVINDDGQTRKVTLDQLREQVRPAVGTFTIGTTGDRQINLAFEPAIVRFTAQPFTPNYDFNTRGDGSNSAENYAGGMHGFALNQSPIFQRVVHTGGSGSSINNTSHYASTTEAIHIRFANANGQRQQTVAAEVAEFNPDGFKLNVKAAERNQIIHFIAYR